MKLKSATINDFRRFTHLTVRGIPETAQLILEVPSPQQLSCRFFG